jgi:hypothetical protein
LQILELVIPSHTDASDKAVGAVLSQVQDSHERVIAYMSKSMNIHEQSYCVTRKELLAVILSSYMFLALVTISLSDLLVSLGFSSKKQLHCLYGVGLPVRIGKGETFYVL